MGLPQRVIYLGYEPREYGAFAVARYSISRFDQYTPIRAVRLDQLRNEGLYQRETRSRINGEGHVELIDVPSIAPDYNGRISTEHANARFFVIHQQKKGWGLISDCDVFFRCNPDVMFAMADPSKALQVVHHDYEPAETVKMDGQQQTKYARKNQSSVMLVNFEHRAHQRLTLEMLNALPGRLLHQFCWLEDDEIGELPPECNYLVGVSKLSAGVEPKIVHFTRGLPDMPGWENQEYAQEWHALKPAAVGAL